MIATLAGAKRTAVAQEPDSDEALTAAEEEAKEVQEAMAWMNERERRSAQRKLERGDRGHGSRHGEPPRLVVGEPV